MQMQMHRLLFIILCFLLHLQSSSSSLDDDIDDDPNHISINCGGAPASTSLNGRQWGGDALKLKVKSSSTAAVKVQPIITGDVDPVPYSTARVSRSRFSYSFQLTTPGQKFIRLHFNPVSYNGFESFNDFFTVEAGPFTLLANFSASITARALSLNLVVKEFCIIIQQNQPLVLDIVFSPETRHNYAFVNGIEIISVPSTVSYCHGGDSGVNVLGQKSVISIDNDTVLERVYQQNIKWGSVSFANDIGGMFGIWASILEKSSNKATNLSFGVSVDVGFRYLVRVHLCEVGLLKTDFMLMIDNILALTSADIILQQSENRTILWYNYMVMVQGKKREGNKHTISISLHSQHELVDRQGPLEGFEVFKLSNHDFSLSTPNPPLPPKPDSPPPFSILTLLNSLFGLRNAIATLAFTVISLVNIILHLFQNMWGTYFSEEEEENEHLARPKQPCRRFTLAEIQSATENFHNGFFVGKGGFGNVYKGFIDNGREIVAIKRLKPDSSQGEQQFWTEVEMLSELRHVNLVSLLGFCIEQQEMMLVYEFMPSGTLADHLFKYAQKRHDYIPLSWKQRLKICIGAGRALDYLHTGHGIIHRDVKSSNILLDERFVAKVSDFGLAKPGFGSESQIQHSTLVKGTHGYLDPYYCETRKPTKNSDTYSFGVVLLEVLCGRRALERHSEEDKCRLTTWAIDYISKGQVDQIVFPSLIGEISPDSLKTFVRIAKRCLHDEPKKRPAIGHVVMKLVLALQQQEKAESPEPNERNSVEDWFPTTDNYQKETMNFTVSNEKINIVDTLPQMERRNVTDAIACADNDRTMPRAVVASSYPQTVTSLPFEQNNSTLINDGREKGRKSLMLRISQILWPWDAFWNTRKSSNKTNVDRTSVSAPIIRRTSNITMDGNTITNRRSAGMILTPIAESLDKKEQNSRTILVTKDNISNRHVDDVVAPTLRGEFSTERLRTFVNIAEPSAQNEIRNVTDAMQCADNDRTMSRPMTSSSNPQTVTSLPFEKNNSTMIHSGRKGGRRSTMLRISQKLWPWNAFSKTRKPANKTNSVGTSVSVPISKRTGNITKDGYTITNRRMLYNQSMMISEAESNEKEQLSQTVRVMDNIRKGQVDHIVAPTMREENSPDSMRKFIDISETCMQDETKNQPTTMHIATDIELALQQLVIPEYLPPKGGTIVEGISSSAGTYQREGMNFMVSNEKINVIDGSSQSLGGQLLPHPNLRVFSLAELKVATRNFRSDSVLGEGGFGKVYKGWLEDKASAKTTIIAVKKLNSESMQGFEEWKSEVNFLGRLSHPNLVKLLGYGWEDKELLLVYEFMPKGSFENHLFGRGASVQPLPWDIRLKILIGAARGMAFLHASDRKVIYRDFKASNILLDGSYHAKISDFGLAKMGPIESKSYVSTQVMGTYGYAAPEYIATGHLYVKSDVYGFGVVLVEMLTGLRALDTNRPSGQHSIGDWIKPHLSDRRKLKHIIDVRLEGRYPSKSALHIAQLALTCLENEPKNRPSMQEIVETLERIGSSTERPRERRSVHSVGHQAMSRRGHQQHLQYHSPLHPREEATQAYPLPQRI